MTEDIMVTPSEEIKALMRVIMAGQISEPLEVILSDDAGSYLRTKTFLETFGCGGLVKDRILYNRSRAALQRSVKAADLFLKMQMLDTKKEEAPVYRMTAPEKNTSLLHSKREVVDNGVKTDGKGTEDVPHGGKRPQEARGATNDARPTSASD